MNKENNILLEMYENAKKEFKNSGYHPHPANLLAMLLLQQKDNFEPLKVCEGVFYKHYKDIIDDNIAQVIVDFKISKKEIEAFLKPKVVSKDIESDKIWFLFADGFCVMHGELMYRPNQTAYQMYCCMDNKCKWYKMTNVGLEEFPPKKEMSKMKVLI